MTEWIEKQICLLKEQYQDVLSLPYGGLDPKRHFQIMKIKQEYHSQIQDRFTLYIERIKMEVPKLKQRDILGHYQWVSRHDAYTSLKDNLYRTCMKNSIDFINSTLDSIKQEWEAIQAIEEKDKLNQKRLQGMQSRHSSIQEWREKKVAQIKMEFEKRQREMQDQVIKNAQREQQEGEKRAAMHGMIEEYHLKMRQRMEKARLVEAELQQKEQQEKKAISKVFIL